MPLLVVVPTGQAPIIQVTIPAGTIPTGQAYTVTGAAPSPSSEAAWTLRGGAGTSTGEQVVLTDALAPINTPVTYTARWDGGTATAAPVRRPWAGRSLMTDTIGTGHVDLLWQGDDQRAPEQRITLHQVPGRPTPIAVMAPAMGAGTVTITARTSRLDTRALAALAASPGPVALFHNPDHCFQCARGVCDVPLVTVLVLTDVSHARASRVDVAERSWSLKGAIVSPPMPSLVIPSSTWDQFDARAMTWDQVDALRRTWDVFDRTIWQETG